MNINPIHLLISMETSKPMVKEKKNPSSGPHWTGTPVQHQSQQVTEGPRSSGFVLRFCF